MNKLLKMTKWVFTVSAVAALVFIYSCGSEDDPVVKPSVSYASTSVAVGTADEVTPAAQGDPATSFSFKTPADVPAFITINGTSGVISISEESTTGEYSVVVVAGNEGGTSEATAEITVGVNASGFDPTGKSLVWKYFMNNTADVVMENLNTLPGQEDAPAAIPLTVGWPGGTAFQIDPMTDGIDAYFTFALVQSFLLQVPGDDACAALDPAESGDNLLVIVNADLTLSTLCQKGDGSTVEIGTSAISYKSGAYIWTLNMALQGTPVSYVISNATFEDFTDPLDPHFTMPSGTPRTFPALTGTVEQFLTPTDFADYLGSLALLNVDVVLEVL